jgi:hypothetical protein
MSDAAWTTAAVATANWFLMLAGCAAVACVNENILRVATSFATWKL